jgi:anthranilate phosphoribosyltransferase
MKRETPEENRGVLSGIMDCTTRATADVDELVDIADPYDGYNRTLPPSPFLPALLAACVCRRSVMAWKPPVRNSA